MLRVLVEEWLAQIHQCAVTDEFVPQYIPGRSALVVLPLTRARGSPQRWRAKRGRD